MKTLTEGTNLRPVKAVHRDQARRQEGDWGNCPRPWFQKVAQNFQVNQAFDVEAKKLLQCKSMKLLGVPILLQFLVEPDQSCTAYHFSMVNQTLCTVTIE